MTMLKILQSKDALSGLLFFTGGLVSGVLSLDLPIGDRVHMGPGYVPLALSIILSGLGIVVFARGMLNHVAALAKWPMRSVTFVVASSLVFGLTIERTGLLLSVFLSVLTAAVALPEWRRVEALGLAAGLSIFSAVLFVILLKLPIQLLP